jgi:hypothetical protein
LEINYVEAIKPTEDVVKEIVGECEWTTRMLIFAHIRIMILNIKKERMN